MSQELAIEPQPMKNRFRLSEDWTVVVVGFLIIGFSLGGFLFPVPDYTWSDMEDLHTEVLHPENLAVIGLQFTGVLAFAILGFLLLKRSVRNLLIVFPVIYFITILALVLTGNSTVRSLNLEAVIFSLGLGLLIGNIFRLPEWFRSVLSTELFVKIGLVLLGTGIIFGDILKAGSLGLIQALAVVLIVWYFAYYLCKWMKIDDELGMMISSAVSICGVSAAIATSGAIHGNSRKLSYVISMVLITAVPMMIFMPYIASYLGLSQEVTGAWLGGSIDTTGAVVASGSLVGETALKISTIVKFSQNVLLGLAAFAISVYWTFTKQSATREKPTLKVIWDRFPKFVIGFVAASLLFSLFVSAETTAQVKGSLKNIQGLWFALAFTSIGLETNFRDLFRENSRKPFYAFLIAQGFNIIVTLVIAYFLFG